MQTVTVEIKVTVRTVTVQVKVAVVTFKNTVHPRQKHSNFFRSTLKLMPIQLNTAFPTPIQHNLTFFHVKLSKIFLG